MGNPASPTSHTLPSSPAASSTAARPSRRRQRSTRLVAAAALIGLAAASVVASALPGSWLVAVVGGAAAVVLGAVAARMTYAEVVQSRRVAATDRAAQAQGYRRITETRTGEHAAFAVEMQGRIARRDATIGRLEKRLADTADEVASTRHLLADAQAELLLSQAELAQVVVELEETTTASDRLALSLVAAEDRASQAVVRVAELEQELDVVLAQWQADERSHAKHA